MLSACALELARRFEDGGCLWCLSPRWPDHAHHLAVEFVHPVIVGKRALPAVAVTDAQAAESMRDASRPGDALVVIDPAPAADLVELARRAKVWGLATVWIGAAGSPPGREVADHVLLCDDPAGLYGRQAVLAYHLLWELVHVCLEHPGLLREPIEEVCITCSDQARPAEVVSIGDGPALVRSERGHEYVDVSLVPLVAPGDTVLVHAGVAITTIGGGPDGD